MTHPHKRTPALPPNFWADPATIGVLTSRDVPQLLRLVQKVTGLSQTQMGLMIGKSQGEVSEIMSGARRVISVDILVRIVEGFQMPDAAAAAFLLGRVVVLNSDPLPVHAVSLGANTLHTPAESPSHWAAWYGGRTAQILTTVDHWNDAVDQPASLQHLLHQEILMFDAVQAHDAQPAHAMGRRQVLMTLAALPLALLSPAPSRAAHTTERFLARCAASVTACWHLLRGSELHAVDQVLAGYLLGLETLAEQRSPHQAGAARLASQAHRICGIVALHRSQLAIREHHCKRAVHYAALSGDVSTKVSALISLASTYFYTSDPERAATIYREVLDVEDAITPLKRSRAHAEISVVQAQLGRQTDALRSIEAATELYPKYPDQDPSYLYAEFTPASLHLEHGLAYLALAEKFPGRSFERTAGEIFAQQETLAPDRIRFEITNHQARTAVLLNDLVAFEEYMSRGVQGIVLLGSQQRKRELWAAWQRGIEAWSGEPRLSGIREQLSSIPTG